MSEQMLDPMRIRILRFERRYVPASANTTKSHGKSEFDVTLALSGAEHAGLKIERVTLQASGPTSELRTESEVVRMLLTALTETVRGEQKGTPPGSP